MSKYKCDFCDDVVFVYKKAYDKHMLQHEEEMKNKLASTTSSDESESVSAPEIQEIPRIFSPDEKELDSVMDADKQDSNSPENRDAKAEKFVLDSLKELDQIINKQKKVPAQADSIRAMKNIPKSVPDEKVIEKHEMEERREIVGWLNELGYSGIIMLAKAVDSYGDVINDYVVLEDFEKEVEKHEGEFRKALDSILVSNCPPVMQLVNKLLVRKDLKGAFRILQLFGTCVANSARFGKRKKTLKEAVFGRMKKNQEALRESGITIPTIGDEGIDLSEINPQTKIVEISKPIDSEPGLDQNTLEEQERLHKAMLARYKDI